MPGRGRVSQALLPCCGGTWAPSVSGRDLEPNIELPEERPDIPYGGDDNYIGS